MSCLPGSPCYNTATNCGDDPCNPNGATSCETVVYNGPNLPNTGIESCDNFCVALQKIDAVINGGGSGGGNLTFSNGLTKTGNNVTLGGTLTTNTVINTAGLSFAITSLPTQPSLGETDFLLMETSVGIVKKVSAGSVGKNITIRDNNNGLVWNDQAETILDTLYQPAASILGSTQSQQVGFLQPDTATNWRNANLTINQVLDAILFPTRRPIYTIPTVSWTQTGFPTILQEVGTTLNFTLNAVGNKQDAGPFTRFEIWQNLTGTYALLNTINSLGQTNGALLPAQSYGATDPNIQNIVYTGSYTSPSGPSAFTAQPPTSGTTRTVSYKAIGYYDAGLKINMSNGAPDDRAAVCPPSINAPVAQCSLETNEISMTSTYPFFYGYSTTVLTADDIVSRIQAWLNNSSCTATDCTKKLTNGSGIATSAGNVTIQVPTNEFVYMWVAHYAQFNTKTKFYSQAAPNIIYDIGSGATATIDAPVLKNITMSLWGVSPVSYKVYVWKSTPANPTTNASASTFIFQE